MVEQGFWHGSHTRGLKEILPNKGGHTYKVFASSHIIVSAFFTSYPDKYSFLVDRVNRRVYTPSRDDLIRNDRGGSIYRVTGDFKPASDKLIFEYEAKVATVIDETEIDSLIPFVSSLGFLIYADSDLHREAYFYQDKHDGRYPKYVQGNVQPLNTIND